MEAVRAFNNELSSLYETRPPVSRAKMASVTKCAIKAIKFYKHVVQSVEKFVQKCKPEYKVPGLYVIDSIVRQSRHQFGSEKDVFAPRFTKNIVSTFQNLFKCPQEERCRVVRVLNLWQKNNVFPVEVIQPLLDLAADPNNVELVLAAQRAVEKVVSTHQKDSDLVARASSNGGSEESLLAQQSEIFNTVTRLLQQTGDGSLLANAQESQLQQLQLLQQQLMMHTEMMSSKPLQTPPILDSSLLAQIKMLTDQLLSKTSDSTPPPQNSQTNSGLSISTVGDGGGNSGGGDGGGGGGSSMSSVEESGSVPPIKKSSEPCFNKKLLDFDYGDSDDEEDKREENSNVQQEFPGSVHTILSNPALMQHIQQMSASLQKSEPEISDVDAQEALRRQHLEQQQQQFDKEISQGQFQSYKQQDNQPAVIVVDDDQSGSDYNRDREQEFDKDRRRSKRSHERSRSPRRRRHSRSRSRDRRRSRDRHRRSRSRDHDREQQKEKERERKKKGLPPLKDRHISVCTRTLWFGHLAKHTTEDELRAEIEKYGGIDAINMIPPRGCAFVCMSRRKDASKALDRLKGYKLNSSSLRVAWAPGIGVKESSFKDLWDVELGVTYIPWSKMPSDLVPLTEGGMIDDDSLPEHLKGSQIGPQDQDDDGDSRPSAAPSVDNQLSQMPNFGIPLPGIPSSQPIHIMPPPMMIPIPSQPPPQLQSQGHLPSIQMPHLGQGLQPPQGLPPNLLAPQGGQSMPVSTTISLPSGVSLSQAVSVAASLLGAPPPGLPISSVATMAAMSADRQNLGPGIPTISTAALLPQGPQQPGILARPGFPPPGPPGSPFGLVPNLQMRPPGFLHSGQGLRAPVSMHIEKEMEEPKEWPADDNMLEEEALAALEEDMDHRVGGSVGPGGDPQQNLQKGPAPLMTMQMMGMRMRLPPPPPGGPRMAMQMAGNGSSRPGMMMDMTRSSSNPGMSGFPMGPGGAFGPGIGRPGGILGPRLVRPGGPQIIGGQEGPEAMMRNPMQGSLMGSQAGTTMGMRLGLMGGHGPPRGIGPGNMAMGQRLPGMPGSPGMHGMGAGPHGPIRIMLGNQQNTRGPGPMGLRPAVMGMDNRLPMGEAQNNMGHGGLQGPRTSGEENSLTTNAMNTGSQGQVHLSMSQGPGGMLPPGLIMGAGLRGGRPGLLGFRPNMPTNGGFRFGPQQPGGIGFRGTRPDFSIRPPGFDNPLIDGAPSFSSSLSSGTPVDDDGGVKSPEYGENFDEGSLENRASLDADLRMAVAAEAALEVSKPRERSGRQSRWSDVEKDTMLDMGNHDTQPSQTNGPTSDINSYPDTSEETAATNLSETELVGSVGEG